MNVKEKKVGLFELFYDLVYVYAISRITLILEDPVDGGFTPTQMAIYLISTLTVLQAWIYMTNYINRYGGWRWFEYLMLSVNMFTVIYLAQAISPEWGVNNGRVFIGSMFVLIATIMVPYAIQIRRREQQTDAARTAFIYLGVVQILFAASLIATYTHLEKDAFLFMVSAVALGAVLPYITPKLYDESIVSFPHLAERFELLTIITFGEAVVAMTGFFDINEFSSVPWTVFITFFLMFACYVVQIHNLCDHHRVDRGLRLIFTHYFIIVSVNLLTVSYILYDSTEIDHLFRCVLTLVALLMFFFGILSNSPYYFEKYTHSTLDFVVSTVAIAFGGAVMFLMPDQSAGFLYGTFAAVAGNFIMLMVKVYRYVKAGTYETVP